MRRAYYIYIILLVFLASSCATWHERTIGFHNSIAEGNFEQAEKILDKNKNQKKNRILYLLNKGYVEFMLGRNDESNEAFEEAEILIEQQSKNVLTEAAVLISNPELRDYKPEDFEVIMIYFYKAMNYLQVNDMDGALVEARKINIRLQQLNDKYPDHKNRYQRDAFAHLLMGLIYDSSGDANNAFIAYRNAYDVYQSDYVSNFSISAPLQLKKDLMRTAHKCGFTTELSTYEKEFNIKYTPQTSSPEKELILFWLNGMGPVKAEWGLDFIQEKGEGGIIIFQNEEMGLSFPFFFGTGYSSNDQNSIANLRVLRVVFPKYVERPPAYLNASLTYRNNRYPLEITEDINQIAFKTLQDRMLREFSNSLLRLAVKQSIQYVATKENDWLGFAVGIANAMTEKADTRNWQTLPYSISYVRIPLSAQENEAELKLLNPKNGIQENRKIFLPTTFYKLNFIVYSTLF